MLLMPENQPPQHYSKGSNSAATAYAVPHDLRYDLTTDDGKMHMAQKKSWAVIHTKPSGPSISG